MQKKIHNILNKGTTAKTQNHLEGEFITNFSAIYQDGGGGGGLPTSNKLIKFKHLKQFITYQHFKMESFHCLENIFKNGDYMCKLHLRDAYFSVPLNPVSRKFVWVFLDREVLLVFFFAFVLD